METKETENRKTTYKEIETAFREEAGSLIPEETILRVLEQEKIKFECAEKYEIASESFMENGISRYVKGLLRKCQPFSFLYSFLGFMMEFSMLLLLYMVVLGAGDTVMHASYRFMEERGVLYAGVLFFVFLLFSREKKRKICCLLLEQGKNISDVSVSPEDKQKFQKKIVVQSLILGVLFLLFAGIFCVIIWKTGVNAKVKSDIVSAFLFYVIFALLSGIHNVLYSSHFVPFFAVGGSALFRRTEEEKEEAVKHYKMLSYERILNYQGKTIEDFSKDASLAEETMQKLRERMVTYRVFLIFGGFIFLVLDVLCVIELIRLYISVALVLFTCCSFLGTFLFLTAFLSTGQVLKTLPKKKRSL